MSRFRVTSVGGRTINQDSHGGSGAKLSPPVWYVLDSANCFHVVREFRFAWKNRYGGSTPEADARALAAELERDYP